MSELKIKHADSWRKLQTAKGPSLPTQRTIGLATTHLLFKVIEALVSQGENQLADSILNSTSHWKWNQNPYSSANDVVESVNQFPSGLRVENRKRMFALDPSPDKGYYQTWVINRVMEQGGLWVWAFSKTSLEAYALDIDPPETSETLETGSHNNLLAVGSILKIIAESVADKPQGEKENNSKGNDMSDLTFPLMNISGAAILFGLGMTAVQRTWIPEVVSRRATFDIDVCMNGNTLMLTPFQMVLESIPRASLRAMSVSWVVEVLDCAKTNANVETIQKDQQFKVRDIVRGMWKFTMVPNGRYNII